MGTRNVITFGIGDKIPTYKIVSVQGCWYSTVE